MINEDIERLFNTDDDTLIEELHRQWNLSELVLLGKYTEEHGEPFGFFKEVESDRGIKLSYPCNLGVVSVSVSGSILKHGTYYKFKAGLSSREERQKNSNSFLLQVVQPQPIIEFNPKYFVQKIFARDGGNN
jgi:hypothetical protein